VRTKIGNKIKLFATIFLILFVATIFVGCSEGTFMPDAKTNSWVTYHLRGGSAYGSVEPLRVEYPVGVRVLKLDQIFSQANSNNTDFTNLKDHHIAGYYYDVDDSGDQPVFSNPVDFDSVDLISYDGMNIDMYIDWEHDFLFQLFGYDSLSGQFKLVRTQNIGSQLNTKFEKGAFDESDIFNWEGGSYLGYYADIDTTIEWDFDSSEAPFAHPGIVPPDWPGYTSDGDYIVRVYAKWQP